MQTKQLHRLLQAFHDLCARTLLSESYLSFCLFFLHWPWCLDLYLNGNLKTEMARLHSRVCWGAGSLKNPKGVLWFRSKTYSEGLHPALSTSCRVVWIFVKAATLGESGETGSQITPSEVSVSGQPIISFVCDSLGEDGASFSNHGWLGGPRAGKGWLSHGLDFHMAPSRPQRFKTLAF